MKVSAAHIAVRAGVAGLGLPFDRVQVRPMPKLFEAILGNRITAITLGRVVLVDPARFDGLADGEDPVLFAHEMIHVAQWEAEGSARFLYRYLTDYLRLRALGLDHHAAYRHIGYEWDAYEQSARIVRPS